MKSSDELIANLKNMTSREVLLELLTTIKTQESEIVELKRVNKNQHKELEGKVEAIGRLLAVVDELEAKLENAIVPKFKIGQEYRELVKQYAGQIVSHLPYGNSVKQAHALAKEVLASLETEGK